MAPPDSLQDWIAQLSLVKKMLAATGVFATFFNPYTMPIYRALWRAWRQNSERVLTQQEVVNKNDIDNRKLVVDEWKGVVANLRDQLKFMEDSLSKAYRRLALLEASLASYQISDHALREMVLELRDTIDQMRRTAGLEGAVWPAMPSRPSN